MAEQAEPLGARIRRYRLEREMSQKDLAHAAGLSKGYLSELESGSSSKPSGAKLYAIAQALGVGMTDLLGQKLRARPNSAPVPASLREFADRHNLPEADVRMLAGIQFRGDQPRSADRWSHIYTAIRSSGWLDESQSN